MQVSTRQRIGLLALFASALFTYGLNSVTTVAMPAFVLNLGGNIAQAGILNGAFIACAILLRFIFSRLIDRLGPKTVLAIGSLAFCVTEPLHLVVVDFWPLLGLRLMQSIGLAAYLPACSAYVTLFSPKSHTGRYLGIMRLFVAVSTMFFPLFSFPFIENADFLGFFTMTSVFGFIGAVLIATLQSDHKAVRRAAVAATSQDDLGEPLPASHNTVSLLASNGFPFGTLVRIAPTLCTQLLASLAYSAIFLYGQVYMRGTLPELNSGLIFTLLALGQILAGIFIGTLADRRGATLGVALCLTLLGGALILFGIVESLPLLILAGILCGLGNSGFEISAVKTVSERARDGEKGFAVMMQQNSLDLGLALGSLVFGMISVTGPSRTLTFALVASIVVLCSVYWWWVFGGKRST